MEDKGTLTSRCDDPQIRVATERSFDECEQRSNIANTEFTKLEASALAQITDMIFSSLETDEIMTLMEDEAQLKQTVLEIAQNGQHCPADPAEASTSQDVPRAAASRRVRHVEKSDQCESRNRSPVTSCFNGVRSARYEGRFLQCEPTEGMSSMASQTRIGSAENRPKKISEESQVVGVGKLVAPTSEQSTRSDQDLQTSNLAPEYRKGASEDGRRSVEGLCGRQPSAAVILENGVKEPTTPKSCFLSKTKQLAASFDYISKSSDCKMANSQGLWMQLHRLLKSKHEGSMSAIEASTTDIHSSASTSSLPRKIVYLQAKTSSRERFIPLASARAASASKMPSSPSKAELSHQAATPASARFQQVGSAKRVRSSPCLLSASAHQPPRLSRERVFLSPRSNGRPVSLIAQSMIGQPGPPRASSRSQTPRDNPRSVSPQTAPTVHAHRMSTPMPLIHTPVMSPRQHCPTTSPKAPATTAAAPACNALVAKVSPSAASSTPRSPAMKVATAKPATAADINGSKSSALNKAPRMWKCSYTVAIRQEPSLDARRIGTISDGSTFLVSEELRDESLGITFLKLADGRGWIFDSHPVFGKVCEHAEVKSVHAAVSNCTAARTLPVTDLPSSAPIAPRGIYARFLPVSSSTVLGPTLSHSY